MKTTPRLMKLLLNIYPPYVGAGVKVESISPDWRELRVSMKRHWYNRNYFGTHFGGSLYSMVDPHLALLLVQLLGRDYVVWDKSARIEFLKATRQKVSAVLRISDERLAEIRQQAANGEKIYPRFTVEIRSEDGQLVARVEKELYVRRKRKGS